MKIYTKTGDKGKTSIIGKRVSKASVRMECIGTIDEVNAWIGESVYRFSNGFVEEVAILTHLQHQLFDFGADLAHPKGKQRIQEMHVTQLEQWIDAYEAKLPPLTHFILPGGSGVAASVHVARTVTRRAERLLVHLTEEEALDPVYLSYINRLSDLWFVLARYANQVSNQPDIPYQS